MFPLSQTQSIPSGDESVARDTLVTDQSRIHKLEYNTLPATGEFMVLGADAAYSQTDSWDGSTLYRPPTDAQQSSSTASMHPFPKDHDIPHSVGTLYSPQVTQGPPVFGIQPRSSIPDAEAPWYPTSAREKSQAVLPLLAQLRTSDFSTVIDPMLAKPDRPYPNEPTSATTASSSSHSSPVDTQVDPKSAQLQATSRARKARREKPHIDLAPDQPPTTQGKPRARVYVACIQCRNRKIRCDGARPICHFCQTRGNEICTYDPIPKRRGPDKTPGARQRVPREAHIVGDPGPTRRRRRKSEQDLPQTPLENTHNPLEVIPEYERRSSRDQPVVSIPPAVPLVPPLPADTANSLSNLLHAAAYVETPGYPPTSTDNLSFMEGAQHRRHASQGTVLYGSHTPAFQPEIAQFNVVQRGYTTRLDDDYEEEQNNVNIAAEPSLDFSRKTWWDSLLSLYTSPFSSRLVSLTTAQRDTAARSITDNLRFLFRSSNYWFSFFYVPGFFRNFCDTTRRDEIQPSLILAALAIGVFFQSSEVGEGHEGRQKALRLRDEAQGALEASLNAGWIDETLAQAAWLLAMFEVCAHPFHSSARAHSSMLMLDSIIRSLSLTFLDAHDPDASVFAPRAVPSITPRQSHSQIQTWPTSRLTQESDRIPEERQVASPPGCSCIQVSLGHQWSSAAEHTPLWVSTPAWDTNWSEAEIRKESCRRLCWSTMSLAAGHSSYTAASKSTGLDLFVVEPSNYALLFPGEALRRSPTYYTPHSGKETVWALYNRTMFLWHSCLRMRRDSTATIAEKSHFGLTAWLEADALEAALNKHTCNMERAFLFQGREYLFNVQMCISYEFQRFIPLATADVNGLFHRIKAEEWLTHQLSVGKRVMQGLHMITGHATNILARRPFFVFWFMGQIFRALTLWQCDNSLTVALDVCKSFLAPIDYLTALWPCPEQRSRYENLRERLSHACYISGVPPPAPMNISLPTTSPASLV